MEILNYIQARKAIIQELSEEQIGRILTISGRAKEWIGPVTMLVAEKNDLSDKDIVEQSSMGRTILKNSIPGRMGLSG